VARELFRDVTDPSITIGNRQWHTLPLSILAHIGVIALLIVVPLMAGNILPTPRALTASFVAPALPPAPPPPPARLDMAKPLMAANSNAAPLETPPAITPESGLITAEPETNMSTAIGGVVGMSVASIETAPPISSPPSQPLRIGGDVKPPKKIRDVNPIYSAIAQSARVQGVVILEATIGVDGHVEQVRVLRSIPLLDGSAIEAVKQWQYTPTLLNGVPVAVIMTVTVNFTLR
jgi:periplasmic protein TonB